MRDLIAERDLLKKCNQVQIQATKENAERIRELLELIKDLELQTLRFKVMPYQNKINLKLQEQHAKVLIDKEVEIQTLKTQLAASQEESARKEEELQEYHAKESSDKRQLIYNPNMRLCLEEQQYSEKIVELMVLQEKHVKQIEDMDLELKTLQGELAAGQEQHAKELNGKNQVIQRLAIRLSGPKQQTVDKIMELTNEKNRHSQVIQKFREESLLAERRLESVRMIYKKILREKMKEADLELTQLHTKLDKLYIELQEAKKDKKMNEMKIRSVFSDGL